MIRIGLLTSGGDCQALNAAMRGVAKGLLIPTRMWNCTDSWMVIKD